MAAIQTSVVTEVPREIDAVEWDLRVQLAACYRIVDYFDWCELIYGHISLRVPGPDHHFLINPYGLRYDEMTASSLVKIDLDGNLVMHTHSPAGMAVAALECGLLNISMNATSFYNNIGYHDYEGSQLFLDERKKLAEDLGTSNVMILRNHGLLSVGRTVPEAFLHIYRLERACQVQLDAMACRQKLVIPSDSVVQRSADQMDDFAKCAADLGQLEFDALVRLMDQRDPSFRN